MADTYTQYYSNFIGVDMSSDPRTVARNRLAYSVNMWRDYESNQGAAVETFPGFRRLFRFGSDIKDVYHFKGASGKEYVVVLASNLIYGIPVDELVEGTGDEINGYIIGSVMHKALRFVAVAQNNRLYLLGSNTIMSIYEQNTENKISLVTDPAPTAHVPTTYFNGKPYEQRNVLTDMVIHKYTDGGIEGASENTREFVLYDKYTSANASQGTALWDYGIIEVEIDGKSIPDAEQSSTEGYYVIVNELPYDDDNKADYRVPIKIQISKSLVYNETSRTYKDVVIKRYVDETHFEKVGDLVGFSDANPDYKKTARDAVLGCTKSAVYDGRVFLTGNPELPNTVFYSQRNLTGANDPTYFGAYNYFNDGEGNTPNVDLLSTPSVLMVIKGDTIQDGSVYYHVGSYNEDESTQDLMPRIYTSTKGAAGIGSVGITAPGSQACNFLDDPVFLSRRGLEAVGKETVNAERTIVHRSSNVDKLLIREDLSHASIAEWKNYLVICCNGHIYLADSRYLVAHSDGSYQYEWYYLEGLKTYEEYGDVYRYATQYPLDQAGGSLANYLLMNGYTLSEEIKIRKDDGIPKNDYMVSAYKDFTSTATNVYYAIDETTGEKYLIDTTGEKRGTGEEYPVKTVLTIGDRLILITDRDICVVNTDKRGVSVNGRAIDVDKIDTSYYTYGGVKYISGCALRLDDCDKKSVSKTTIYGTTAARFKMVPGSRCVVKATENGQDWYEIGEAFSSHMDFADIAFDTFSYTGTENNVMVFPEISRSWVNKQYYFESDGYCQPFGLYELSYIYKIAGRIRY